jgi:hypothetical protein
VHDLRAHILGIAGQLDRLRHRHAIGADARRAERFLDESIVAFCPNVGFTASARTLTP